MITPATRWSFRLRASFVFAICGILAATILVGIVGYRVAKPNPGEMLRVTLVWGRLAPLPATAQDFVITTVGSPFTWAIRSSFSAPIADVDRWLDESPGTSGLTPKRQTPSKRKYLIAPGEGAQHAEVNVDDNSGVVEIYVYWS